MLPHALLWALEADVTLIDVMSVEYFTNPTCNGKFSSSYLVCVMLACIFIIFEVLSVIYIVG